MCKVGDRVNIDGDSSFCTLHQETIAEIKVKYNEDTGEAYKVIVTSTGSEYDADTGACIKGATAYYIDSYYAEGTECNSNKYYKVADYYV